jgi:hypothetical protein
MNKKNRLRFTQYGLWLLADVFGILLDVMARLGRNRQTGPLQPDAIECRYVA